MDGETVRQAFLSSTGKDLTEYRKVANKATNSLQGWKCVRMEDFTADARTIQASDADGVRGCDLFIGILGHCYGTIPDSHDTSYTEQEYEAAVAVGVPRLMFIAPEDFPHPANLRESEAHWQKQRAFRKRAAADQLPGRFSSPDDLATAVIGAIRNWEHQERKKQPSLEPSAATEAKLAREASSVIPAPPAPYFVQPYPLQENFTGRVQERRRLSEWYGRGDKPVLVLEAIGGMGKSAVAWVWLLVDLLGEAIPGIEPKAPVPAEQRPQGVVWWSFYEEKSRFAAFVTQTLAYLGIDPAGLPSLTNQTQALREALRTRRLLLVLDGFERELRAYASLDAAYRGDEEIKCEADPRACVDLEAARLFREIGGLPLKSRVVITSRLLPKELESVAGLEHVKLRGLSPEDGVAFFHAQGIKGIRAEIEAVCAPHGYHPLILRLLTGLASHDFRHPSDVRALAGITIPEDAVHQDDRRHHILHAAYGPLSEDRRALLGRLAAFRAPVAYDTLTAVESERAVETWIARLRS